MKRFWLRLMWLLAVVSLQSCCWSQCPQPERSAVQWHTPIQSANGS
jgi:hypothetical protein